LVRSKFAPRHANHVKVADIEPCPDELQCALTDLRKSYGHFMNTKYACGLNRDDLGCAMQAACVVGDLRASAATFEKEIQKIMQIKVQLKNGNWSERFTSFLGKLYPLARLSLGLTSAIAGVLSNLGCSNTKASCIATPLQAAADALGTILQV
jgi:hypothetical protein